MSDDDKTVEIKLGAAIGGDSGKEPKNGGVSPWAGVAALALICATVIACCGIAAFALTQGRL